jgi:pyrroloquinoline quinone biosynthesis protein B
MPLELRILGSAAGGGLPQWNCGCLNCSSARKGQLSSRTQDSVAVSANGRDWFLLNASPDVARQIESTPELWPRAARHSPIQGVVLTNGDLDHVLGLLLLREGQPLSVYATPEVRAGLEQNRMLRTLMRFDGQLVWRSITPGSRVELAGPNGPSMGIFCDAFGAPGKPPLHLMGIVEPSAGDNVGLRLRSGEGGSAVYLSATSSITPIAHELDGSSVLLLDGTFWSETELVDAKLGHATAREMAHLPLSGEGGSVAACAGLRIDRRIFTHINNTNPILQPASSERRLVAEQGWELAEDGMCLRVS